MQRGGFVSDNEKYQRDILPAVSRTFALTIPQLPSALRSSVTNAYLLCRVADTIEDEVALDAAEKAEFQGRFIDVLEGRAEARLLARELSPRLSAQTNAGEHELVANLQRVVAVTQGYNPGKRDVLVRCARVMCEQMPMFQHGQKQEGLPTLASMNHYCYAVAGVVGEMLTELFCNYSDDIAAHYGELMRLAPSFGQGLQMTNILKDVWDDHAVGACWLPQDVFDEAGCDLRTLSVDGERGAFAAGLSRLLGIAHGHLRNALAYSLLVPRQEAGVRRFLLWNVNLAVATLRRVHGNPLYRSGDEVKVGKGALLGILAASSLAVRRDRLLRLLFDRLAGRLPLDAVDEGYFVQAARLSSF